MGKFVYVRAIVGEEVVSIVESDRMLLIGLFILDLRQVNSMKILHIIDSSDYHNKL